MMRFSFINSDTIWGVGGTYNFGASNYRGIIYKTTNGGVNWGYQIPDTAIHITGYTYIKFVDRNKGWAYHLSQGGVHTTTGGITGIQSINHEIPEIFILFQNFPNPFNPVTDIRYGLRITAFVTLKVYDITGKQISLLTNKNQRAGVYEYNFDGSNLSSGIYFCVIQINTGKEVFTDTKKMILIK